MSNFDEEDTAMYKVVLNDEQQYSIWPMHRENAPGWFDEGKSGLKRECLDHINVVWVDMRPLSLQKQMLQQAAQKSS
jgi:MbtH protein